MLTHNFPFCPHLLSYLLFHFYQLCLICFSALSFLCFSHHSQPSPLLSFSNLCLSQSPLYLSATISPTLNCCPLFTIPLHFPTSFYHSPPLPITLRLLPSDHPPVNPSVILRLILRLSFSYSLLSTLRLESGQCHSSLLQQHLNLMKKCLPLLHNRDLVDGQFLAWSVPCMVSSRGRSP